MCELCVYIKSEAEYSLWFTRHGLDKNVLTPYMFQSCLFDSMVNRFDYSKDGIFTTIDKLEAFLAQGPYDNPLMKWDDYTMDVERWAIINMVYKLTQLLAVQLFDDWPPITSKQPKFTRFANIIPKLYGIVCCVPDILFGTARGAALIDAFGGKDANIRADAVTRIQRYWRRRRKT